MKDLSIAEDDRSLKSYVASPATKVRVSEPAGFYARYGKRFLDIFLICLSAPAVLTILIVAAIAVAVDGGSPFYSQKRIGKNGRHFRMWKLRTMVIDAERALRDHLKADPVAAEEWLIYQKLKEDPRITRVGRILRKTSIDELPQLWNVLLGSMSLVGPRPMMIEQGPLYPGTSYYALRPGVTGNWQVSQRNNSTFEDRAIFDADYRQEMSFLTDMGIILKTVPAVLKSTGH